jgi:hypothetical protein
MARLEVRAEEVPTVLGSKPRGDGDGEDEQHTKDDAD